jgi:hypothetical protein
VLDGLCPDLLDALNRLFVRLVASVHVSMMTTSGCHVNPWLSYILFRPLFGYVRSCLSTVRQPNRRSESGRLGPWVRESLPPAWDAEWKCVWLG